MASITTEPNGRRTIQFVGQDGRRRSIRVGKVSKKVAEEIKAKIEHLVAATIAGTALPDEITRWVASLGDDLRGKLAAAGLTSRRDGARLAEFVDAYLSRRTDAAPNTTINLLAAKSRMVEFFGADKNLREVTPGDADHFLLFLKERYADATAGRTLKRAKQFFRAALRQKIISENPFDEIKAPSQVNEARKFFVSRKIIQAVIDACPDAEWRLLVALSRYGGLRCPSEHLALQWTDVDWAGDRFRVDSPKTGERWVPIFPELRPYLTEVFELAEPGAVHVITRYRDANANLRTQLQRIIRKAGVPSWPKLFHNLRASRETELTDSFPIHVVCSWIGNSALVAQKHYLQVTPEHFERAAKSGAPALQNPVQHPAAPVRTDSHEKQEALENQGSMLIGAGSCETVQSKGIPPRGLEPLS